jgi:hypothetical protein
MLSGWMKLAKVGYCAVVQTVIGGRCVGSHISVGRMGLFAHALDKK